MTASTLKREKGNWMEEWEQGTIPMECITSVFFPSLGGKKKEPKEKSSQIKG